MKSFSDILRVVGRSDKDTRHTYGALYDQWFAPLRNQPVQILEVGVCVFGGCVLSLAEYFQKGTIWAVDISRDLCDAEVFRHPRIEFIQADAYQPAWLSQLAGKKFDVIIDDASHEGDNQLKLLGMLQPFLKNDGFHVIEDCCTSYWLPRLTAVRKMGLQQTLVDMSTATCYDNTIIRLDPA